MERCSRAGPSVPPLPSCCAEEQGLWLPFGTPTTSNPVIPLSAASFAPISFAIKVKENDLLPLEKNRVRLDDDSDEDDESREGQENVGNAATPHPPVALPPVVVEEKKPQLTQEELEAKQGLSTGVAPWPWAWTGLPLSSKAARKDRYLLWPMHHLLGFPLHKPWP